MGKPKSVPVPDSNGNGNGGGDGEKHRGHQQQPLSGSKKTKQRNHVDHNNPEG